MNNQHRYCEADDFRAHGGEPVQAVCVISDPDEGRPGADDGPGPVAMCLECAIDNGAISVAKGLKCEAIQRPQVVYRIVGTSHERQVEQAIDILFEQLATHYGLTHGDIAPEQQALLDASQGAIAEIVREWLAQNSPDLTSYPDLSDHVSGFGDDDAEIWVPIDPIAHHYGDKGEDPDHPRNRGEEEVPHSYYHQVGDCHCEAGEEAEIGKSITGRLAPAIAPHTHCVDCGEPTIRNDDASGWVCNNPKCFVYAS